MRRHPRPLAQHWRRHRQWGQGPRSAFGRGSGPERAGGRRGTGIAAPSACPRRRDVSGWLGSAAPCGPGSTAGSDVLCKAGRYLSHANAVSKALKFGATHILLLGMILCPSRNQVTCGRGQLAMGRRSRTAACPCGTTCLWSVPRKFPMSAEKKHNFSVLETSLRAGRGTEDRQNCCSWESHNVTVIAPSAKRGRVAVLTAGVG